VKSIRGGHVFKALKNVLAQGNGLFAAGAKIDRAAVTGGYHYGFLAIGAENLDPFFFNGDGHFITAFLKMYFIKLVYHSFAEK